MAVHALKDETPAQMLSAWLQAREHRYGGLHHAPRRTVSPHDPRSARARARGSMQGGDRMSYHAYASAYADELHRYMNPDVLARLETRYAGGIVTGIRPVTPSPLDALGNPQSVFHGHRMQPKTKKRAHNYAPAYAQHLPGAADAQVVIELGILRGVGLAIWCDLFPAARVIGLDVDLSHFREAEADLKRRGAFSKNAPEVYSYDELAPDAATTLTGILRGDLIDVFIDDALHYDAAILKTAHDVLPLMRAGGVYFVEDNFHVHEKLRERYPQRTILSREELTIVRV